MNIIEQKEMMRLIEIDLTELERLGISPNEYVYLRILNGDIDVIQVPLFINFEHLYKLKYIDGKRVTKEDGEEYLTDCFITDRGRKLFKSAKMIKESVTSWIEEWRDLFPAGVKTMGYPVKGDKNGCIKKMSNFVRTHKEYTKDIIFEATKYYIGVMKSKNYEGMQQAHNFIKKEDHSTLAAYCEELKEALKENKPLKRSNGTSTNKTQRDGDFE